MLLYLNVTAWALLSVLGPMTLDVTAALGLGSEALVGVVQAAFLLVSGALSLAWAALEGRAPRTRLLAIATALWATGTLCTALARSLPALLAAQLLTATGHAAILPLAYSVATDLFGPMGRARAFGYLGLTNALGMGFGILLAGLAVSYATWPVAFLVLTALGVGGVVAAVGLLHEPKRGATETQLAAVLARPGVQYSAHLSRADLQRMFRSPVNRAFVVYFLLLNCAFGGVSFYFVAMLRADHGFPALAATLFMIAANAPQLVGNILWGRRADVAYRRRPDGKVRLLATTLAVGGMLQVAAYCVPVQPWGHAGIALFTVLLATGAFVSAASSATGLSIVGDVNPPETRATMFSVTTLCGVLGRSAGILICGALYDAWGGVFRWGFALTTGIYLLLAILLWAGPRRSVPAEAQRTAAYLADRARELETS